MEEKIKQLIQQYNKGGFTQSELEWELLNLYDVSGSLRNDRIKEVAKEIANSKTKGFSEEWEKFREEEYKYWLKRIRWATRSNDR